MSLIVMESDRIYMMIFFNNDIFISIVYHTIQYATLYTETWSI